MIKLTRATASEFIFALAFLLLGLYVLFDAFSLEEPGVYSVVSPRTFAIIIGAFTTFVGVMLTIEVLRGNRGLAEGTQAGDSFLPPDFKTMGIVIGAILLHIALLERIGYIAAAAITFYGVAFAFGSRKFLKDIFISFAFAVVVYVVFSRGLRIFLPEGIFEDLFQLSRETTGS